MIKIVARVDIAGESSSRFTFVNGFRAERKGQNDGNGDFRFRSELCNFAAEFNMCA